MTNTMKGDIIKFLNTNTTFDDTATQIDGMPNGSNCEHK
jgi:hypothetical protein